MSAEVMQYDNNPADIGTSIFSLLVTVSAGLTNLIPMETLIQGVILAILSTLIGYYGNKLLKVIDKYFKEKFKR